MDSRTTKTMSPETKSPANQDPPPAGQRGSLSVIAGSAFPTYAEMHKALDDLHIVCECATMPEVETWYRGDAFAKEARQRAIDVLCRHTYAEREREILISFREAVRRIADKPIDSSDMMDEIEHLLSLPQNTQVTHGRAQP